MLRVSCKPAPNGYIGALLAPAMAWTPTVPEGQKITVEADGTLNVPDQPIIAFIEGDGTGTTDIKTAFNQV